MPGFNVSQLSSNWKKLQEKLEVEKKEAPSTAAAKRKRLAENGRHVNGYKKAKLSSGAHQSAARRGTRMGLLGSKAIRQEEVDNENAHSDLIKQHGISKEDISTAYGKTNGMTNTYKDDVNGRHHPTHKVGKFVALDCEMVGTGPPPHADNILARVSLVNFQGEQIYDSYVMPRLGIEEVKDYRTRYSGITEDHLKEGFARPLAEVQRDIADLLDGRILVGHALHNDLDVLLLSHPKRDMRDTSRYPKFKAENGGKPPALRYLAREKLGIEIQTGEHSSIEDARSAMMLFKMEKVGFEEENLKRFGPRTKVEAKGVQRGKSRDFGGRVLGDEGEDEGEGEDDDEFDEEDDMALLNGEEDEAEGFEKVVPPPRMKKKKKTKKRTKRK